MFRVLVVDDEALIRWSLSDVELVAEAYNARPGT